MSSLNDRFEACIWGGAIGDAFGAPLERLARDTVLLRHPDGLQEPLPIGDKSLNPKNRPEFIPGGQVTDDTNMLAMTLIAGAMEPPARDQAAFLRTAWQAYLVWGSREAFGAPMAAFVDPSIQWPDVMPAFNTGTGAGRGTIAALLTGRMQPLEYCVDFGDKISRSPNTGCGGMMRIAPLAFMVPQDRVYSLALKNTAITHGAPEAQHAAASVAEWVAKAARGASLERALGLPEHEGLATIFRAVALTVRDRPFDPDVLEFLPSVVNGGKVDQSTLFSARSVFAQVAYVLQSAAARAPSQENFKKTLRLAVNITGDSDSVGAICGNVLGAAWGTTAIPQDWAAKIEQRPAIAALIGWAGSRLGL